jgi:HD superfamily phosphodiesterase
MENVVDIVALKMVRYFGTDVRRINHALKVHDFAKIIAGLEGLPSEKQMILETASLFHDIGIKEAEKQYQSTAGHYQEMLGPDIACVLLKDLLPENIIDRVCYLIGHHHTYGQIDGLDYQILVEADFLVNIFEDQMNQQQIALIREKYFKTKTGIELIQCMYLD